MNRLKRLRSLREAVAALSAARCGMSHERVVRAGEPPLPVASRLPGVSYERVGLCAPEARACRLGCSHTTARVKLADAAGELERAGGAGGGGGPQIGEELSRLDNEIHLLDHRRGEAEKALARALEAAHRAGRGLRGGGVAGAEAEVRELERLHGEYVERVGLLRDRVVAGLDRLIELAEAGEA